MSARVLVVDDILPNVKLLEAKLMSEYYDVLTATNGKEALEKVEQHNPDIILLDVMMPGMDGFEVCTKIKQNPKTSHIPVVMVTALTDAADRVRGLEAGADDFLSKPLNDTALMARVRSLVRLKMTIDEWRTRENTANQLGVVDQTAIAMNEPVENAKVLVVEDQSFESDKFKESLAIDNNQVEICLTGLEAMGQITRENYDLIVISLNLEKDDGLRLVSHLRSAERSRHVPLLMIGSQYEMPRVVHGLEIGAHDYILRPVDRNELLARVRTQIRRKRFQERLRSTYELSLSMALTDSLTGLYNRRYFEVHLQKLIEKNKEGSKSLGVLMMDIDHFKQINDTYGHMVGDEILKTFARRVQDNLRSFDLVARLGGEEFIALLPDVGDEKVKFVAERLRRAISEHPFQCSAPEGAVTISTSIGGLILKNGQHSNENILKRVDDALYEAKNSGRNCTVFEGLGKLDANDFIEGERNFLD